MCAAQAVAIARHANDPVLLAKTLKMLGVALCEMGKPADAVPVLLEALENARSANDAQSDFRDSYSIWGLRSSMALAAVSPTSVSSKRWTYLPEHAPNFARLRLVNQGQLLLRIKGDSART